MGLVYRDNDFDQYVNHVLYQYFSRGCPESPIHFFTYPLLYSTLRPHLLEVSIALSGFAECQIEYHLCQIRRSP